jgi:hypothetical protein
MCEEEGFLWAGLWCCYKPWLRRTLVRSGCYWAWRKLFIKFTLPEDKLFASLLPWFLSHEPLPGNMCHPTRLPEEYFSSGAGLVAKPCAGLNQCLGISFKNKYDK